MSNPLKSLMRRMQGLMFKLPLMITCAEFEDFVLAYLEGDLSKRQKFVFEMHLALCRECREYLAAYRTAMALAKGALGEADSPVPDDVPEDLIKAVLTARDT